MMRYFYFFLIFSALNLILFSGCKQSDVKPASSGKSGELIVVMDSTLWKLQPGHILRDSLMVAFPAIPQYEPTFKIIRVQPDGFKNILQLHRNVLMIEIGPLQDDRNYLFSFKNNVWATPQLVLNLKAVDETQLEAALLSVTPEIISRFNKEELNRMIDDLNNLKIFQSGRVLDSTMGIYMPMSEDFFVAKNEPDYIWIRKETINISMGFQVSRIPYTDDSLFSATSLISLRDSISKLHIPGPSAGSYMQTDANYPVSVKTLQIDSCYSFEMRGLWRTEGDFMGGPFLCYLIHDKKKNELLFVDAFVYAPKFNKREYVKQMEAMVKAIKLTD